MKVKLDEGEEIERPTVEQTRWVLIQLQKAMDENYSFRGLIYDLMGYNAEAYCGLYPYGMNFTNFSDQWRKYYGIKGQEVKLHRNDIELISLCLEEGEKK